MVTPDGGIGRLSVNPPSNQVYGKDGERTRIKLRKFERTEHPIPRKATR